MNLYLYTVKGDPTKLMATWRQVIDDLGKEEFFLNVATTQPDGIAFVDVCPSEADFQGWINGDDWREIKGRLGGEVSVTPLGEIHTALARDTVVEVVHAAAHAH